MHQGRKVPFNFHNKIAEFEKALWEDVSAELKSMQKQIIPSENISGYTHGTKWRTKTEEQDGDRDYDEMQIYSSETEIPFQEIVDHELEIYLRIKKKVVDGLMQEFTRSLYQVVGDAADETGNVVNADGCGFKAEHFIEMLEKIEFGVDRDGKISLPEIHVGPELAVKMQQVLSNQGPEFDQRVEKIKHEKTNKALQREQQRKSKFSRHNEN